MFEPVVFKSSGKGEIVSSIPFFIFKETTVIFLNCQLILQNIGFDTWPLLGLSTVRIGRKRCSAIEYNQKVDGSNLAECWAFVIFLFSSVIRIQVLRAGATQFFIEKMLIWTPRGKKA